MELKNLVMNTKIINVPKQTLFQKFGWHSPVFIPFFPHLALNDKMIKIGQIFSQLQSDLQNIMHYSLLYSPLH